jgi:hypothetical protein
MEKPGTDHNQEIGYITIIGITHYRVRPTQAIEKMCYTCQKWVQLVLKTRFLLSKSRV